MMEKNFTKIIFAIIFVLTTLMGGSTAWAGNGNASYVKDELLIQFHRNVDKGKKDRVLAEEESEELEEISPIRVKRIRVPASRIEKVKAALSKNPHVSFVEYNYIAQAVITPNDEKYPSQWHLSAIAAPEGWDINTGSQNVAIAIIDSGITAQHEDLYGKIMPGYNFLLNNTDTSDVHGHGTAVSGSAAAISNNFTGVAGVAWGNPIMPLLVVNSSGSARYSDIARAITYAVDNGVRVMNISIAGSSSSWTLQNAADYAWNNDAVIFAAAGNSNSSIQYYPAACDNVVAVSATTSSDGKASFSNHGSWIDIAAPGVSILTTNKSGYSNGSGTSFSSPIAAGLGALVISANPSLTNAQVVNIIEQNADDLGDAGFDPLFGHGRINVYKSILAATGAVPDTDSTEPSVSITSPVDGDEVSENISVNVSATDNVGVTEVELYINDELLDVDASKPFSFYWNIQNYPDGYYELVAFAYDRAGNVGQSVPVIVHVSKTIQDDTEPPLVSIMSPEDGSLIRIGEKVEVSASDNVRVSKVKFYFDGRIRATKNESSNGHYTIRLNQRKLSSGDHVISVKAYDDAGNVGTDSITVHK
jgi:subtilisin family serine protease